MFSSYDRAVHLAPTLDAVPSVTFVDNVSAKNCDALIFTEGSASGLGKVRQLGRLFSNSGGDLVITTGSASFGELVSSVKPTHIVYKLKCAIPAFTSGTAGAPTVMTDMMPAGANQRFFGRVRFQCQRTGVADWIYVSATVLWDGTTLTVTQNINRLSGGSWSAPTFNVSGGNLNFVLTSSVDTSFASNWFEFDGECWDA